MGQEKNCVEGKPVRATWRNRVLYYKKQSCLNGMTQMAVTLSLFSLFCASLTVSFKTTQQHV